MAVREVLQIGDPKLREPAAPVSPDELRSEALGKLVADMVDTMRAEGGIGIAAPQIGVSLRVALIEIPADSTRYPDAPPTERIVLVNPRITVLDASEQAYWEGCLSVPNLRGLVHRPRAVRVDFLDLDGTEVGIEAEGFLANVFQHELDHLDGVLFVDRVRDPRQLATLENYRRFWLDET